MPKTRFSLKTLIVAILVFAISLVFIPRGYNMLMGFDRSLHNKFKSLEIGTAREDVIATLGEPIATSADCCLPQRLGYESEFARATKSSAVKYYLWRNGMNWYYCLGFDESSKLVFVSEGHS